MPLGEPLGGGEEMLRQLLREGRGRGVEWRVVFLRPGSLVDETRQLGIEVEVVEAGRFRQMGKRLHAVRALAARARDVDLVLGWMVAGQTMAGPAAWLAGRPNVWYQVGTPRPDLLDRFATIWPARCVIALSTAGVQAQRRIWPRRRVELVYPGAAMQRLDAVRREPVARIRQRLGIPVDRPVVGIVARLQRWKGVHVFIDAIAALRASRPDILGVIVGGTHETEPDYRDQLADQVSRLGLGDHVRFVGYQPNGGEWMHAMDVVVHASDREPFGIVVVEAMALGKPVVAANSGGPAEIVTHGVDGLLTPFGDAEAMAAAIERLFRDPTLRESIGAAARMRAAAFSDAAYAASVVRLLRSVAAGNGARSADDT